MRPIVITLGLCLAATIGCGPSDRPVTSDESQSDSSIESQSLQRQSLTIVARVTGFSPRATWTHYDDGYFEVTDAVTLTITQPSFLAGRKLTVHYIQPILPNDSPLRKMETICKFSIDNEYVSPPEKGTGSMIYDGALKDLTILNRDNPLQHNAQDVLK